MLSQLGHMTLYMVMFCLPAYTYSYGRAREIVQLCEDPVGLRGP